MYPASDEAKIKGHYEGLPNGGDETCRERIIRKS
jgi:hypothetical protein